MIENSAVYYQNASTCWCTTVWHMYIQWHTLPVLDQMELRDMVFVIVNVIFHVCKQCFNQTQLKSSTTICNLCQLR